MPSSTNPESVAATEKFLIEKSNNTLTVRAGAGKDVGLRDTGPCNGYTVSLIRIPMVLKWKCYNLIHNLKISFECMACLCLGSDIIDNKEVAFPSLAAILKSTKYVL